MKILLYTSCYGNIFKSLWEHNDVEIDCREWFLHKFDYEWVNNYDIIIFEYVSKRRSISLKERDIYNTDIIVENVRKINKNIKIIIYPFCNMHMFELNIPIIPSYTINKYAKTTSKLDIINLFEKDKIVWNVKESFDKSMNDIIYVENLNNNNFDHIVKYSDYIFENYKNKNIFLDRLVPSKELLYYICEKLTEYICLYYNLSITNIDFDTHPTYIYHKKYECLPQYIVDELELNYPATDKWKHILLGNLKRYLKKRYLMKK